MLLSTRTIFVCDLILCWLLKVIIEKSGIRILGTFLWFKALCIVISLKKNKNKWLFYHGHFISFMIEAHQWCARMHHVPKYYFDEIVAGSIDYLGIFVFFPKWINLGIVLLTLSRKITNTSMNKLWSNKIKSDSNLNHNIKERAETWAHIMFIFQ